MPDYTGLTTEELITTLNTRDATITQHETDIVTLNQTIADKDGEIATQTSSNLSLTQTVDQKNGEILQLNSANEQLQSTLDQTESENVTLTATIDTLKTPIGAIVNIGSMTAEQKKELASELRTTKDGRLAMCAMTFGR